MDLLKTRVNWADSVRGVAILSVVFGHIASPISNFIFSWHMPLFFFLSGFFVKMDEKVKIFFEKNFRKLFSLFLIFSLLGFTITYFRDFLLHRQLPDILQGLSGIFFWMDYSHLNHYGMVLWFLPALFWGRFLVYLLIKFIKNNYFISIIIAILFFLVLKINIILPYGISSGILASLWIYLGYLFYKYWQQFIFKYNMIFYILTIGLLIILPISELNLSLKYFSNSIYNIFYSLLMIILIILITKSSSKLIKINNLFSYLGVNSLFIFIFHVYTNNIAYLGVNKFFNNIWYIKFILSFVLIFIILKFVRKYLNKGILKYV